MSWGAHESFMHPILSLKMGVTKEAYALIEYDLAFEMPNCSKIYF
jgi:hypothetical protein